MRLIFIRHAEPDYEHDCLTAKGRREAELLSRRTARWENIAGIYVSPLGRARETASYTLRALKKEAVTLPWLREFSYPVRDPENGVSNVPWDFLPEYYTRIPQMYDKEEWLHTDIFRSNPFAVRRAQHDAGGVACFQADHPNIGDQRRALGRGRGLARLLVLDFGHRQHPLAEAVVQHHPAAIDQRGGCGVVPQRGVRAAGTGGR